MATIGMEQLGVFLSSTSQDLQEERSAVEASLRRMDIPFIGMEYFGSDHRAPLDASLENLHKCSIFVGVTGFCYGSLVPGSPVSFTECEYHEATKLGMPRIIYLKSEDASIQLAKVDTDRAKIDAFRALLKTNHTVSYFLDGHRLAAMVTADLFRLLSSRKERISIVKDTDLLQMPRVMLKRAEMALLSAVQSVSGLHAQQEKGELTRTLAQAKALDLLRGYRFRFDGQFTVLDSHMWTVFHDLDSLIGRPFKFTDVKLDSIFATLVSRKQGGTLKWVDQLSSDYLIISDAFYSPIGGREWIRFNVAPCSYFGPWDWHIFIEAHNEIHGLDGDAVHSIVGDFQSKGWLVLPTSLSWTG